MKKYIFLVIALMFMAPFAVKAQAVDLTDASRQQLITELQTQIATLYQQIIQILISQMNTNTDKIVTAITSIPTQNVIQYSEPVATISTPITIPKMLNLSIAKASKCRFGATVYQIISDGSYDSMSLNGTLTTPSGEVSTMKYSNTKDFEGQTGDTIDYVLSAKDKKGTEIGTLSGTQVIESCV